MSWQEIIKPEKPIFKTPTQYSQNTQKGGSVSSFEDIGNTGKGFLNLKPTANISQDDKKPVIPYLDDQGRFCVKGLLPDGTILDELIKLGASDTEIEKHIFPVNHLRAWQRWQEIKQKDTM